MSNEGGGAVVVKTGDVGAAMPTVGAAGQDWDETVAEDEIQTITENDVTGGTFTVTYDEQETTAIPYDATGADVEAVLELLSTIGEGNVQVTGIAEGPFVCTFINDLGSLPIELMTIDDTEITGGGGEEVVIAETNLGVAVSSAWTTLAVDAEQDIGIVPEQVIKQVWPVGAKRPKRIVILHSAIKSVTLALTESAQTALATMFPNWTAAPATRVALSASNVEAAYVAIAIETPFFILELKKVSPVDQSALALQLAELTTPEITFETCEDDSGIVGYMHFFT